MVISVNASELWAGIIERLVFKNITSIYLHAFENGTNQCCSQSMKVVGLRKIVIASGGQTLAVNFALIKATETGP